MDEIRKTTEDVPQKPEKGLRRSSAFKAFMVLVSALSVVGVCGGALLTANFVEEGVYTKPKQEIGKAELQHRCKGMIEEVNMCWQDIVNCQNNTEMVSQDYIDQLCRDLTDRYDPSVSNFEFVITDAEDQVLLQSFSDGDYQYSWTAPFYSTVYDTTQQRMTSHEWSVFQHPNDAQVTAEEVWISEPVQTSVPETSAETFQTTEASSPVTNIPVPETLYSMVESAPQSNGITVLPTETPPLDSAAEEMRIPEESMQEIPTDAFYEDVLYYDVTISYPITTLSHYITGYVRSDLTAEDDYARYERILQAAYDYRYVPPVVLGICIITLICSLCFLLWAAGWHKGKEAPEEGAFEKIPFDVFTCLIGIAGILLIVSLDGVADFSSFLEIGVISAVLMSGWLLLLWWLVSTTVRIRTKTVFRNTLVAMLWRTCWKASGKLFGEVQQLPLLWLVVLVSAGFFFLHLIGTVLLAGGSEFGIALLILLYTASIVGICAAAVNMYLLEKGAEKIAGGDLEHKIPVEKLFGPFRKHGQHLNSIGDGMNHAVSERMKSERFRTELIANVSHDIRTPLTSIVNYTDLLSKLELKDPQAQEYVAVLIRQSAKLRKLTEDVLEASKASTGSVKVERVKLDLRVLAEQLQGEYTEKLEAKRLQMICTMPEEPLYIMADGRLMWRVMDNLFNNICKYAMEGTRVYLDASSEGGTVLLALRNISAVQLHISADMLMERFVQGDRSRNTEGSGLGLSIAQSLTSLQGGTMELSIDGDLFKAELKFPESS